MDTLEVTKQLANKFHFECLVFRHDKTGRTTGDAEKALGIESKFIIKSLLFKSSGQEEFVGVIVKGCDKVNIKILKKVSGFKKVRMAHENEILEKLGYEIGGITPVIFCEKVIRTFVDNKLLELKSVVGSGGSPFHAMVFDPKLLVSKLGYKACENLGVAMVSS